MTILPVSSWFNICQLLRNTKYYIVANGNVCLCSVEPLTELRTHQRLRFFRLFPSTLSPVPPFPLCTFMKHIHKNAAKHANLLQKLKHFQLICRCIFELICMAWGEFTPIILLYYIIELTLNSKVCFTVCLNILYQISR